MTVAEYCIAFLLIFAIIEAFALNDIQSELTKMRWQLEFIEAALRRIEDRLKEKTDDETSRC